MVERLLPLGDNPRLSSKQLFRSWDQSPGFRVHLHRTRSFKTISARLVFHAPLDAGSAARALVPRLLGRGTRKHPSLRDLQVALDRHFGASLRGGSRKIGERHLVQCSASWINDALAGSDLTATMGDFWAAWLHDPLPDDDGLAFREDLFESERKVLSDDAAAIFDDKVQYARHKLLQLMCKSEPYARPSIGHKQEIDSLTRDDVRGAWQAMVGHAPADLFLVGNLTVAQARRFAKRLALHDRSSIARLPKTTHQKAGRVRTRRESQDITQANLEMGFRTSVRMGQKQMPAYVLMNAVFGGTPVSKLFKHVREEHSLCYSVHSAAERTKGLLFVHAGIEEQNYAKARRLILKQLDDLKAGKMQKEFVEMARGMIVSSLRALPDSAGGIIDFALERLIAGAPADLDGLVDDLSAVTQKQIARAAQTVELDSVFLLRS